MEFIYNDGGRGNYFKGETGDCCCRAICNTTGLDYKRIYDLINKVALLEKTDNHYRGSRSSARNGVFKETAVKIIEALGGEKIKVQEFGSRVKCHLCDDDLFEYQYGKYLLVLSHHYSSLINGKLVDTYDCSRDGDRQVYCMYKMNKSKQKMLELLEAFEATIDKKINNKKSKQEKAVKRNVRLHNKINQIDLEIKQLRDQINKLTLEKAGLMSKVNH